MEELYSTLPLLLQKQIEAYFKKRAMDGAPIRLHVPGGKGEAVPEAVQNLIQIYEACVFAKIRTNGIDAMVMIPSANVGKIINKCIEDLSLVSFYVNRGALTISADRVVNGSSVEIHFVARGRVAEDIILISDRISASLY